MAFRSRLLARGTALVQRGSVHSAMFRRRFGRTVAFRPGVGIMIRGRRGGFFKKLFKGVAKVAKFVAPAVVAIAKTAAKHTVVGKVVSVVNLVKKRTAVGAAALGHKRVALPDSGPGEYPDTRRRKRKTRAAKGKKARRGRVSAKQAAARKRFAAAARKGRIRKGARL